MATLQMKCRIKIHLSEMLHLRDNVFFDDFDEKDNADKQALAAERQDVTVEEYRISSHLQTARCNIS